MRRYLVAFEGSPLSRSALEYAIQLAKSVPGVLDICYIADVRLLSNPVFDLTVLALQGIGMLGDLIPREQAMLELQAKLVAKGEDLVKEASKSPGLDDKANPIEHTTRVEVANPPAFLADTSENYDIIFLGLWGETHELKAGLWGGTSEAVIRRGKCPIFLATNFFKPLESIVVGFDNRARSREALAWAGMIGEKMGIPVSVVVAAHDEKGREKILDEARIIADSHGCQFNYFSIDKQPARAVLDAAKGMKNPLICLGAFGDAPIREMFLGSVAEEILRQSPYPVLLLK